MKKIIKNIDIPLHLLATYLLMATYFLGFIGLMIVEIIKPAFIIVAVVKILLFLLLSSVFFLSIKMLKWETERQIELDEKYGLFDLKDIK